MMPGQALPDYQCGELRVAPALGLVSNGRGESMRLGPVNMKVLSALLAQPGRMVSRTALFEGVWPNQIVSDDALTRCVSDIRGQLRKLSGRDDWIETLPKRGYRWIGPVGEAPPVAELPAPAPDTSAARERGGRPALRFVGRGIAYLIALAVMATVAAWGIGRLSGPREPIIALLPVTSEPVLATVAAELDRDLRSWLARQQRIRLLARSAIDARPANPFPYFQYEFGARWVVEAGLQEASGQTVVSVAVADARTGIVEMQYAERMAAGANGEPLFSEQVRRAIDEFFTAQLER